MNRREVIAATPLALAFAGCSTLSPADATASRRLVELENRAGGRLGAGLLDTGTGGLVGHRLDERFGMCSTFKLLLAAMVLRECDRGAWMRDEAISFTKADLFSNSPVTTEAVQTGGGTARMTVVALAEAAQVFGDNAAANLLIKRLGGPKQYTAVLRSMGDPVTRLDRFETELNFQPPGEVRDTTTPAAMAHTMAKALTTDWLHAASRAEFIGWMQATTTGPKRLRAHLPAQWKAGDKTGTGIADGMAPHYNDIAIAFPLGRAPLVVTAYYNSGVQSEDIRDEDQAVLAEVGRIAADWITA